MKLFTFLLILITLPVLAVDQAVTEFANATQEARYQKLTSELRCVVCQNQSLADSNAELAQDLRNLIRSMILEGKNDQAITGFLVERYGDFVLYTPPLKSTTYLLWLGPLGLLLIALGILVYFIRGQRALPPLTAEERNKIEQFNDQP